jgi:hypothetical protein
MQYGCGVALSRLAIYRPRRIEALQPLRTVVLLVLALCMLVLPACKKTQEVGQARLAAAQSNDDLLQTANGVIQAMKARDGPRLAQFVHSERGVRFSPYAYVDVERDRVLSRADVQGLWEDGKVYVWGAADGTGDPIHLTPGQYFERFVFDRDYSRATAIGVNNDRAQGNTRNNAAAVYPAAMRVEFYFEPAPGEGDPAFEWRALRLVFEREDFSWKLIAVIHDEWTT